MDNQEILINYIHEECEDELNELKKINHPTLLNINFNILAKRIKEHNPFYKDRDFMVDVSFYKVLSNVENRINRERNHRNWINIKLTDIPETNELRNLDATNNSDFISIIAMVKNITKIHPKMVTAVFECKGCMKLYHMKVNSGETAVMPTLCHDCGGKSFILNKDVCEYDNQQYLKLEEPLDMRLDGSTREIKAYMEGYLASAYHKIKPGDVVNVYGDFNIAKNDKTNDYDFLIDIHNIHLIADEHNDLSITDKEKEEIIRFSKHPDVFQRFVNSIAPNVYGHEDVKEALVLQLFEGDADDENAGLERKQIHVLLIGDPGIGKSQLLQGVSRKAPKCIQITGTGTSKAGVTSSAVKDELTGSWALEAGAIVLANGGLLSIDEYDKAGHDTQKALNEPMEQLSVSSSKAGLVQTMSARTSVLSAANPKLGRYDKFKPIIGQMNIPDSNLSRFDLIFSLEDKIDAEKDRELGLNILGKRKKQKDEIDEGFFKKYINYAKNNIHPELSQPAMDIIIDFFVDTRQASLDDADSKPITGRDLKALERLATAYAKVELEDEVSYRHAEEAIRIYSNGLKSIGLDPTTASEVIGMVSNTELDLIKYVEDELKENQKIYGDIISNDILENIKSSLSLKSTDGRINTKYIFNTAYKNVFDDNNGE